MDDPPVERSRAAHGVDLGEAVELGRVLGRLPARLVLYAVEAADVGFGLGLTSEVASSALPVTDHIAADVSHLRMTGGPTTGPSALSCRRAGGEIGSDQEDHCRIGRLT
jgi:hypothetical protein